MSNLPERIKAWPWNNHTYAGQWHVNGRGETTEYVRADLFDAVKAERDNYKALCEAERDDELLNIARQAGYQDGAEDRRRLEALVAECDIYLKEGETPRQRMDRDHLDILALGKMLADDRKRRDEAEARVKALTEALSVADDALAEAEAILGGEYSDHYQPLCDTMTDLRNKIAALQENTDDR